MADLDGLQRVLGLDAAVQVAGEVEARWNLHLTSTPLTSLAAPVADPETGAGVTARARAQRDPVPAVRPRGCSGCAARSAGRCRAAPWRCSAPCAPDR